MADEPRLCQFCKHWEIEIEFPSMIPPWGYCRKADDEDGLMRPDHSEGLLTSPIFGCVQWSGQENG